MSSGGAKPVVIGDGVACNLEALISSRLLVQANSGAGKSWALRRLLEQTHGRVQHLVIDPEGEFASLRERFDYVLAARAGGDTVADPRSAKLLAERLLELGVSAILDIYELKAHERVRFVRLFVEALVDAPKALWHPVLVVVDEAHVYCPQVGEAESAAAVKDLCTRGRKRGFCAVLATQRLSKLHKDAAAECNNKLIGRSALDVDMGRAADELGFRTKDQQQGLRLLKAGEFYAFGPALSLNVTKVHVGPVQTSHPKIGARAAVVPPPSAQVRAVLAQLADLPAEAAAREKTVADLKTENATLKRRLTEAQKTRPEPKIERVEVPVLSDEEITSVERVLHTFRDLTEALMTAAGGIATALSQARQRPIAPVRPTVTKPAAPPRASQRVGGLVGHAERLPPGEKATLIAAAQYPDGITREQASILTGYKRSSRDAYIQRLIARGYVSVSGSTIVATDDGVVALGSDYEPLPTGEALQEYWLARLPPGEKSVLEATVNAYPNAVDRDAVDAATGYKRSSRDAYIQRLKARQLVSIEGRGAIRASDVLFA